MPDMVKNFSEIFSNQIFCIPDYQRGYAWEIKQWNDLLEDLDLLSEGHDHFTGTLVLRRNGDGGKNKFAVIDSEGNGYVLYDVIDGQQRLTTIVILLKAIHQEMLVLPVFAALAEGLQETYLYHKDLNGQPFTKLTLNFDSQTYFSDNILELHPGIAGPDIRSHERLHQALQHFSEYLGKKREALEGDYSAWLQSFYFKIIHHLNLIVYPVENEMDAGVIFETMNDRGRPLTELEKVKNYLLYLSSKLELQVPHDLNQRINNTWKYIYESLMAAKLPGRQYENQILRVHWLMIYNYDTSRWEESRSIKTRFSLRHYQGNHTLLLQDLIAYLTTLKDTATAYCDIYQPDRSDGFNNIQDTTLRQEIRMWNRKLNRLGTRASFLPALIAVRLKPKDDGQSYLKLLKLCETYDFRVFQWRRARSNAGETTLYRLAHQYYRTGNIAWLLEEIAQLALFYCPNNTFAERFDRANENWYQWSGIGYFLYEYEHYLADRRPVQLSWETLQGKPKPQSIEHILPQTPTDAYWLDGFSPEQRLRWTHDIGNLSLTFDNSSLSNLRFDLKKGKSGQKGTYADSPLFIERQLAMFEVWTEQEIVARRNEIRTWAVEKRWKIDAEPRVPKPPTSIEDVIENAERFGLGEKVAKLHSAAGRLGMWPTIRKGLQYRSPRYYRQTVFCIYVNPDSITIYYQLKNFSHLKNMTGEIAAEILNAKEGYNWYPLDKLPGLLEAFEELCRISKGE
jgi:hypothetical protein